MSDERRSSWRFETPQNYSVHRVSETWKIGLSLLAEMHNKLEILLPYLSEARETSQLCCPGLEYLCSSGWIICSAEQQIVWNMTPDRGQGGWEMIGQTSEAGPVDQLDHFSCVSDNPSFKLITDNRQTARGNNWLDFSLNWKRGQSAQLEKTEL